LALPVANDNVTYDDLQAALNQKRLSPVYLFYGEEDFLVDEAARRVVDIALPTEAREFNLEVIYGSETDGRDIVSRASSFPMMSDRRVVVVREMDKLVNKELLSNYIDHPLETNSLVLLSAKPDFRKKPYVSAKRGATVVEFKPMYENQIPGWIEKRVRQQGRKIDSEASKLLAEYGGSLREVQNEIDKLFIYVGEKRELTSEDIRSSVGMSKKFNIFELQRAVGSKDIDRSTEIIERMVDGGEYPGMITRGLARYFATVWKMYDLRRRHAPFHEQVRVLKVNRYFLNEYISVLNTYSESEIEGAFELIANAEQQLKSTSIDPRQILEIMVVNLLRQQELSPALTFQ